MAVDFKSLTLASGKAGLTTGVVGETEVSFDPTTDYFEGLVSSECQEDPESILIRREDRGDFTFSLISRGHISNAKR